MTRRMWHDKRQDKMGSNQVAPQSSCGKEAKKDEEGKLGNNTDVGG